VLEAVDVTRHPQPIFLLDWLGGDGGAELLSRLLHRQATERHPCTLEGRAPQKNCRPFPIMLSSSEMSESENNYQEMAGIRTGGCILTVTIRLLIILVGGRWW